MSNYKKINWKNSPETEITAERLNHMDDGIFEANEQLNLLSNDYIVEQGVEGIWTYRKWNSGIAELWGKQLLTNIAIDKPWGSIYESNVIKLPDFPFVFVEIPFGQITWQNANGAAWFEMFKPTVSSGGDAYLARPTSYTVDKGYASMYCIGRYK